MTPRIEPGTSAWKGNTLLLQHHDYPYVPYIVLVIHFRISIVYVETGRSDNPGGISINVGVNPSTRMWKVSRLS